MAYKALYRTYRPSKFDEVVGQQHIVKTIKNALSTNKIAHAYLFAGPRGTGKTTMAKLLAKALNCKEGLGCQCNECEDCKAIDNGTHPDVIEIDAASNNGVDEIRDLIDKVKYGTSLGRYKVYIIDEVHMMTPGAFNALLKTLEEPPEHVIFILATTEPHKILPTILSRCQRYDFSKLSDDEIKERIKIVLEKEKITYNEEAVDLITSLSDGGMRDALSILDQVLAYTGDNLNAKDVLDMFALESKEEILNLVSSIAMGNISDVLTRINNYISRGTDIKRFTNDLLDTMKDLLIYQSSGSSQFLQKLTASDCDFLSNYLTQKKTTEIVDALMGSLKDYKSVSSINPLFEVTLLKLVTMNSKNQENNEKPIENSIISEKTINKNEVGKEETLQVQNEVEKDIPIPEEILILKGSDTASPTHFLIDDKTLIDIIASSKKEIKNQLSDGWDNLKRMIPHPTLGRAATLLIDGHLLVASSNIMIIEHPLQKNVEFINKKDMQKDIQVVVKTVFGKTMFVYAITRNQSISLQKEYLDRRLVGRLPKPEEISLEFEGE